MPKLIQTSSQVNGSEEMPSTQDNWERLVAAVLRKEQLWELFHAHSRSPSVLSDASDLGSSSRSNFALDDVSIDFSVAGSSSSIQQQRPPFVAKSRNPALVFTDGVWPDFGLEDLFLSSAEALGKGTFGSVYSAKLDNGMTIIVKRLKWFGITEQDFKKRMQDVGNVRHPNVAPLRAYYTSEEEKLVLYDHHSSGSMFELLHGKKYGARVDWVTRLRIAIGAARGINHIHAQSGGKLVHGNIKASNIFLNSHQYGYVSDLGMANMIPTTFMPTARCYAPEVKSSQNVSQASDVYSFGILLLELLTRKSPVQTPSDEAVDLVKLVNSVNRKEWYIKVFDRDLSLDPAIRDEIVSLLKIGIICVAKSPKKRPKMSAVVKMLEGIHMIIENQNSITQNSITQVSTKTERNKLVFFGYGKHTFDQDDLFRASAEVLGKGTFGTSYKVILENGIIVSVKRLKDVIVASEEFQQHMEYIGRMGDQNVAEVIAYYYSKDQKLLVYDYYNQGSVSTMLHGDRGSGGIYIDWKTRLEIAVGAARGIAHIHTRNDGKLVHGNIRTSNIFHNEQQNTVVSDVGLANLTSPIRSSVIWNEGDCAPEVVDTKLVSQASDVYSFGVVLLELVSGKSPQRTMYNDESVPLVRWITSVIREEWTAEVIDLELLSDENVEEAIVQILQIALACVAKDPENRPDMAEVVTRLEEISESEKALF